MFLFNHRKIQTTLLQKNIILVDKSIEKLPLIFPYLKICKLTLGDQESFQTIQKLLKHEHDQVDLYLHPLSLFGPGYIQKDLITMALSFIV